jgi:hypothetical protein
MKSTKTFKTHSIGRLVPWVLLASSVVCAGKQRLVLQVAKPLDPTAIELVVPAVQNQRGEIRDVSASLILGDEGSRIQKNKNELDRQESLTFLAHPVGRNQMQVSFQLPEAAYVEILYMDMYGKILGKLLDAPCPKGEMVLPLFELKQGDTGGMKVFALKVNGQVKKKHLITQVER